MAACHSSAPWKPERECHRWKNVHTDSGKTARNDARRARRNPERARAGETVVDVAEDMTRWLERHV
jgi:hypothetical protein